MPTVVAVDTDFRVETGTHRVEVVLPTASCRTMCRSYRACEGTCWWRGRFSPPDVVMITLRTLAAVVRIP
jgi:hypothetical protein